MSEQDADFFSAFAIPWTPEPWDRIYSRETKKGPVARKVVSDDTNDPHFRRDWLNWSWEDFDFVIVEFSGGKDSVAMVLFLLDAGCPREKIELWHEDVDGGVPFMDWPVTAAYVRAFAAYFKLPLLTHERRGGLRGEMLKNNVPSQPIIIEIPSRTGPKKVELTAPAAVGTRMMWPSKGKLETRWCSGYIKIDVARRVFTTDPRFTRTKGERPPRILHLSGERRAESTNRTTYAQVEGDSVSGVTVRFCVRWRPILHLKHHEVWDLMKKHHVQPHPAYEMGFGRCSCFGCIYNEAEEWATMADIAPERFAAISAMERRLKHTVTDKMSVVEQAALGESMATPAAKAKWADIAMGRRPFTTEMIYRKNWVIPPGHLRGNKGGGE